ncbi:hypothetical protein HPB47_001794 [Ixodes persulcatus]|uniref:Uncharacterized protein n=1 Tax=Ixodes persulcatus TaxID=34615 RepID=A0AC60PN11_IXOPE|nr:hypothetical protein HPB47_001794 [Ixodes persulcatus]
MRKHFSTHLPDGRASAAPRSGAWDLGVFSKPLREDEAGKEKELSVLERLAHDAARQDKGPINWGFSKPDSSILSTTILRVSPRSSSRTIPASANSGQCSTGKQACQRCSARPRIRRKRTLRARRARKPGTPSIIAGFLTSSKQQLQNTIDDDKAELGGLLDKLMRTCECLPAAKDTPDDDFG